MAKNPPSDFNVQLPEEEVNPTPSAPPESPRSVDIGTNTDLVIPQITVNSNPLYDSDESDTDSSEKKDKEKLVPVSEEDEDEEDSDQEDDSNEVTSDDDSGSSGDDDDDDETGETNVTMTESTTEDDIEYAGGYNESTAGNYGSNEDSSSESSGDNSKIKETEARFLSDKEMQENTLVTNGSVEECLTLWTRFNFKTVGFLKPKPERKLSHSLCMNLIAEKTEGLQHYDAAIILVFTDRRMEYIYSLVEVEKIMVYYNPNSKQEDELSISVASVHCKPHSFLMKCKKINHPTNNGNRIDVPWTSKNNLGTLLKTIRRHFAGEKAGPYSRDDEDFFSKHYVVQSKYDSQRFFLYSENDIEEYLPEVETDGWKAEEKFREDMELAVRRSLEDLYIKKLGEPSSSDSES